MRFKAYPKFKRWLYSGQRPGWIAKIVNRVWATLASLGFAPHYMATLEVIGRNSGRTLSFPVVIAMVEGHRYLVSMLGEDSQWVRNVRAAGGKAVLRRGGRENVFLEEVPIDQRPVILKAYLQRADGARPHIPVDKSAPLSEFEKIAAAFPAFRIVSRSGTLPLEQVA